jgi:predicted ATPase
MHQGWALAEQGQVKEGIAQMQQGLAALKAMGTRVDRARNLALLAGAYRQAGRTEEGLSVLAEALAEVEMTGARRVEAELYGLKGELTLQSQTSPGQVTGKSKASQKSKSKGQKSKMTDLRPLTPDPHAEAEACFLKAIEIAQRQQAKSLELRAATSLARLWQSQGKHHEAHSMLSPVYNWFTEGFDTADLKEAKVLLDSLGTRV